MKPEEYIAKALMVYFNAGSLPSEVSRFARKIYKKGMPIFVKGKPFYTKSGVQVAKNFRKTVVSDYGAYVEFETSDVDLEQIIAAKQHDGRQAYHKLYSDREGETKFFYQIQTPVYGDFEKGYIYCSVYDLVQYDTDDVGITERKKVTEFKSPDFIKNLMNK